MNSENSIGKGGTTVRKSSARIDKASKRFRMGRITAATARSNLFGRTAARGGIRSRKSPPRLLSAQRSAASEEMARNFDRRHLAPLNPKKMGCTPVAIALAAGLQIVGSAAALSQDAALARPTSGFESDASGPGTSVGRSTPNESLRTAAPDGQNLQCPNEPCDRVGDGSTRDDLEFAQAVKQAREFIRWLTGAGQAESPDQEILESPETSSRRPSPPLGGSVSTEMVIQEHAGIRSGTNVAEHAPATVGFKEPEHDPVTEWKAALLEESGLLARQSEISESILLMERQVKQAELIARLMEINGPDAAIEIAPGKFKVFRDTPAGRRIAAEMAENGLDSQKRSLELQVEIKRKRAELEDAAVSSPIPPRREAVSAQAEQLVRSVPPPEPVLEEVFGTQDRLVTIFRVGETRLSASEGDVLPGGTLVVSISENSAMVERNGIARTHAINR